MTQPEPERGLARSDDPKPRFDTTVIIEITLPSPAAPAMVAAALLSVDLAVQQTLVEALSIRLLPLEGDVVEPDDEAQSLAGDIYRATGRCCEVVATSSGSLVLTVATSFSLVIGAYCKFVKKTKLGEAIDVALANFVRKTLPEKIAHRWHGPTRVGLRVETIEAPDDSGLPRDSSGTPLRLRVAIEQEQPEEEALQIKELRVAHKLPSKGS
jgi:hypothetical protein